MKEPFDIFINERSKISTHRFFLLCLLFPLLLSSCGIRVFERHRPAVLCWATFVFKSAQNEHYFNLDYIRDSYLCKYDVSYTYKDHYMYRYMKLDSRNEVEYFESFTSNSSLFFASLSNFQKDEDRIAIYDKNMSQVFSLNLDKSIGACGMESTENYLYFTTTEKNTDPYSLFRLDLKNHELSKLVDNIDDKPNYIDDEVHLFW